MWRWPWQWGTQRTGQRSTADAPTPGATEPSGNGPSEPAADAPAGAAVQRRDEPPAWQGLPPIQRVTPEEPRLNLPETFTGALAAWRDPSYLAPLGHLVGDAEPAGVLHGAAEPVGEPTRADLVPAAGPSVDSSAPLPLATPAADTRRAAPVVQRQVGGTGMPGQRPASGPPETVRAGVDPPAEPPLAVPPRPVPVEPLSVSRLLTAPPPPVELQLPTVDRPAATVQRVVEPSDPVDAPPGSEPADPGAAEVLPTLGQGTSPTGDSSLAGTRTSPGSELADAGPAEVGGPAASAAPSASDLPLQRITTDGSRPPRRLGLGEPIVSPLLPPPARAEADGALPASTGAGGVPAVQRVAAENGPPPLVHASTAGMGEAVADQPSGQDGGDDRPGPHPTTASETTGLIGEVAVSRLADVPETSIGGSPAGAGPAGGSPATSPGGAGPVPGSPALIGDLPVAGAPGGRTPTGAHARSGADPTGPVTGGTPPVQTFVPPDEGARVAPLLAQPSAPVPTRADGGPADPPDRATDPSGGTATRSPDLPVVSRSEAPATTAATGSMSGSTSAVTGGATGQLVATVHGSAGPSGGALGNDTAGLVGGYGDASGAPDSGAPDAGHASAAMPLVVASLVGDRPTRLLTGAVPDTSAPARPSVQRVTWQQAEAAPVATPIAVPGPHQPEPSHFTKPHGPASASPAPGDGPAPVQRWVGGLPSSPPPTPERPSVTHHGAPVAYANGPAPPTTGAGPAPPAQVVQRADTPPPPDVPEPPTVVAPPAGGEPAAGAGQPAAPAATKADAVEPEELLKKLYDPLLRRLKTELRLDRERHGVLGGPG
ncbi:hypothetical protein GA0074695_2980 [Micromonospora viridifaciens]|uniref:Syndecan 1 n=1 Tax=Micromonospora viridifaciens TaxID=1881 RepID=A0A1C4X3J2_MICVI|nr:hypothetical protein [Micromonospora viridifaciens]SCF03038.1 hypothetical protein GA0074695_2980 [Micromonospora viridifaciens]